MWPIMENIPRGAEKKYARLCLGEMFCRNLLGGTLFLTLGGLSYPCRHGMSLVLL